MKITIFGATGTTGKYLIDEALRRGIETTVFARSSSSFHHPQVRIFKGDLTDKGVLAQAIQGADAILSALGPASLKHPNDLPITRASEAIISVMREQGVRRLVAISTGTAPDPDDRFDAKINLPAALIRVMLPTSYRDIIGLAATIRRSDLDWTMVRVGFLKNRPPSGSTNIGLYGKTKHSWTVSREEVATFMLDQISSREFIGKAPGISTK